MKKREVSGLITKFSSTVDSLNIDLRDDNSWPVIINELLKGEDQSSLLPFWVELLTFFENKEKVVGHCHKGLIFWNLSLLYLQSGDITKTLEFLDKSVADDNLKSPSAFTASIGLSSVLKPLLIRYKRTVWKFDEDINTYYESLSNEEKREFASEFFSIHDMTANNSIWIIKDDFFGFIMDEQKRKIIFDTYKEVRDMIMLIQLDTYYSGIFAIGSMLEGMLDDLFERQDQKVWKFFQSETKIQEEVKGTRLASELYDSGMTLGEKIMVLRLMAKHNILPLPKQAILEMLIIGEYRDLIHPRRRVAFQYKPNRYVVTFLFTMLSRVAGNWWPENIDKLTSLPRK